MGLHRNARLGLAGRRLEAPDGAYPFTATRRKCVCVAELTSGPTG
jgi:hypothetical protein